MGTRQVGSDKARAAPARFCIGRVTGRDGSRLTARRSYPCGGERATSQRQDLITPTLLTLMPRLLILTYTNGRFYMDKARTIGVGLAACTNRLHMLELWQRGCVRGDRACEILKNDTLSP